MYLEHFGLSDEPFRLDPEGEYVYLSDNHRRARTFMEYSLFREGGFVVVTGDIGTGKTTLVEHFLGSLPEHVEIARLARTRLEPAELLQTLMSRLGMEPVEGSRVACIDAITEHLEAVYRRGHTSLLVVDEAQALGRDASPSSVADAGAGSTSCWWASRSWVNSWTDRGWTSSSSECGCACICVP